MEVVLDFILIATRYSGSIRYYELSKTAIEYKRTRLPLKSIRIDRQLSFEKICQN